MSLLDTSVAGPDLDLFGFTAKYSVYSLSVNITSDPHSLQIDPCFCDCGKGSSGRCKTRFLKT
jgi:hypothetical protein